jgi:hypothetical protein
MYLRLSTLNKHGSFKGGLQGHATAEKTTSAEQLKGQICDFTRALSRPLRRVPMFAILEVKVSMVATNVGCVYDGKCQKSVGPISSRDRKAFLRVPAPLWRYFETLWQLLMKPAVINLAPKTGAAGRQ